MVISSTRAAGEVVDGIAVFTPARGDACELRIQYSPDEGCNQSMTAFANSWSPTLHLTSRPAG
jgi:hypothetical protein